MTLRPLALLALVSVAALAEENALTPLTLPGQGEAWMDYLAFDPATHALWIPAGNRGAVYVLDTHALTFKTIDGLPTQQGPRHTMGPSSATVGKGTVYVGNRAGNEICGFDARTLAKGKCVKLAQMPDGLAYVGATNELWATTPRDQTLTPISIANPDGALSVSKTIKLEGDPEGYAVDDSRGLFITNLEDKDRTVVIDVKTRAVKATYQPNCGEKGPRGLALDEKTQHLFVACSDGARTLDLAHDGKVLGRIDTGAGVDNIDYSAAHHLLFVASGKDGKLARIDVEKSGALKLRESLPTSEGARCVVLDDRGDAFVADSKNARLLLAKAKK